MLQPDDALDLATLGARYQSGDLRPSQTVAGVLDRIARRGDDKVWIHRLPGAALEARAAALERRGPAGLPLYGIPFAIKDNIDLAGHPTTAACPEFAYEARASAPVVAALEAAGAIVVGKTNLDQFATGLVGVRSPYGVPANPFDPAYVPGGSSSGSAVAVAAGLVSFALGTDTAGSGRVPAAFNNIVGHKPTRGLLSNRGMVPACRSLDCMSIFALTAGDAAAVLRVAAAYDAADPFSRRAPPQDAPGPAGFAGLRLGVPRRAQREFFGDRDAEALFDAAVARFEALGATSVEVDFAPFLDAARLLYDGPWVAERYLAVREFFERRPDAVHPTTRAVIGGALKYSALEAFDAYYRLKALRRAAAAAWDAADVVVTPTAGTIYRVAEVEADPIGLNSNLGYYTNFMNLLDLCAIAVPAGFLPNGLPFGVTLVAPAFRDAALCALGEVAHRAAVTTMGATRRELPPPRPAGGAPVDPGRAAARTVRVAVCGAHMSGLPLNHQLTERGARLVRACRTAAHYRLYALTEMVPPRPGMVRAERGGAIEVEVWEMPAARFGDFVDAISAPLGIGTVTLEDGREVRGFLCEAYAVQDAREITELGSWRAFVGRS